VKSNFHGSPSRGKGKEHQSFSSIKRGRTQLARGAKNYRIGKNKKGNPNRKGGVDGRLIAYLGKEMSAGRYSKSAHQSNDGKR